MLQIGEYMDDPLLDGKLKGFRILSIDDNVHWFWGSDGVKVELELTIDSNSTPDEILEHLNKISISNNEFVLSEQSGSS